MNADPLQKYIRDHLAGAAAAIDLLEHLQNEHPGEPVGDLASRLLSEILEDRATLEALEAKVDGEPSPLHEAVAWAGAKVSRVKLGRSAAGDFGDFQALEVLALGIQGKLALWRALSTFAEHDQRLQSLDFAGLESRAEAQYQMVEAQRLALARSALQPLGDRV
jgi:hypothetical protein